MEGPKGHKNNWCRGLCGGNRDPLARGLNLGKYLHIINMLKFWPIGFWYFLSITNASVKMKDLLAKKYITEFDVVYTTVTARLSPQKYRFHTWAT